MDYMEEMAKYYTTQKQKDFTLIGMDDYLDGWADVGQQKEFYDTIEKIKEYVEKK